MQELKSLVEALAGEQPEQVTELTGSGSNRRYFRLTTPSASYIGVEGTSLEENRAFLAMARHFAAKGLPVPQVLAQSPDDRYYIQSDLGSTLLFDAIGSGRESGEFNETEKNLLRATMRLLPSVQVLGAEEFDFSVCYPQPEFNERSVFWDLNYFKYNFLKTTGVDFQEDRLEDDFHRLAALLLQEKAQTFMYRDFQSRNVMISEGKPYFIDFQGGRKGPLQYDVASFLWQAKANYGEQLRDELLEVYLDALSEFMPVDRTVFRDHLYHFVLFRTLQVLGAYGYRGYFEKKAHFLQSIPFAIANLRHLLENAPDTYPYLTEVLLQLCATVQTKDITPVPATSSSPLQVNVYSFSYKKGIPQDDSGNGGGFVFDCRAVHNPGKYDIYKQLTGMDKPVQEFLEKDGEILRFLEHATELVDATVQRYIERGFSSLMVSFGCTGGQHRSVYSALKMAEHIHRKFGVEVSLIHREQQVSTQLRKKEQDL